MLFISLSTGDPLPPERRKSLGLHLSAEPAVDLRALGQCRPLSTTYCAHYSETQENQGNHMRPEPTD